MAGPGDLANRPRSLNVKCTPFRHKMLHVYKFDGCSFISYQDRAFARTYARTNGSTDIMMIIPRRLTEPRGSKHIKIASGSDDLYIFLCVVHEDKWLYTVFRLCGISKQSLHNVSSLMENLWVVFNRAILLSKFLITELNHFKCIFILPPCSCC